MVVIVVEVGDQVMLVWQNWIFLRSNYWIENLFSDLNSRQKTKLKALKIWKPISKSVRGWIVPVQISFWYVNSWSVVSKETARKSKRNIFCTVYYVY